MKWKKFTEDLAKLNADTTEIRVKGLPKDIAHLSKLTKLQKFEVYTIRQAEFEEVLKYAAHIPHLRFYELRADNLRPLERLASLVKLELEWNTRAVELWDLSKNPRLESLSIVDFSKLSDISLISTAKSLKTLELSGGMWNKLKLNSIEPIGKLSNLRALALCNFSITNDSNLLQPLGSLKNLKELDLSNQMPTEEYARLSVLLPDTRCTYFKAYHVSSRAHFDDKDTMVTGARKPFLNSKKDAERLRKYELDFKKLQDKFRP